MIFLDVSQSNRAWSPAELSLAFHAAFGMFIAGFMDLAFVGPSVLGLIPAIERIQPLLETRIVKDREKNDVGEISGHLEINRLAFRYDEESPYVLKDISLKIEPGEFVAFVGSSGCGKSTLLKLLLGLEKATSGAVFFDAKDVSKLHLKDLRKQLGVVLQSGRLLPGDILKNICGSHQLDIDEAWHLAEQAAVADDIRAMPMGMHTTLTHAEALLSGGQRQRLLIARALAGKPKILLLDEATSALDNISQDKVSKNLAALDCTRIVVAHRLSTIMDADRIYVFEAGEIVQVGSYQELLGQEGLFQSLVQSQSLGPGQIA